MDEEPYKRPILAPEFKDTEQSTEAKTNEAVTTTDAAPSPGKVKREVAESPDLQTSDQAEEGSGEAKAIGAEPPVDWFEPLEEEEEEEDEDEEVANSWMQPSPSVYLNGRKDPDEESLASVKSESQTKVYNIQVPRRKRTHPEEGWDEWPLLGDGWKRKEVVRRSGSSVGQKDVYYMSPTGDRVRSRVELLSVLDGIINLSAFEYKSGKFLDVDAPLPRVRRARRKIRERSSSESSLMEREEGADTPDSYHRLTPSLGPTHGVSGGLNRGPQSYESVTETPVKLPYATSSSSTTPSRPLPSINGDVACDDSPLVCAKCCVTFEGTSYDRQRKRPCCPSCWAASKTKEHPMVRFRKWIPCGQCVACRTTENCRQCANCKHGQLSREARKRICRKRKCICPIRKQNRVSDFEQEPLKDEMLEESITFQSEITESQPPSYKNSDTENFSVNVDIDDDDELSTDDDDDWHKKRKRRSCGDCNACLCRKDCGTCDFCVDKPKFGGSNKKRQKCRLRQCQRQAMSHWSPESPSGSKYNEANLRNYPSSLQANHFDPAQRNGLPERIHDSSQIDLASRWNGERSNTGRCEENPSEDEEELPMITRIFSLAENSVGSGMDSYNQLTKLLESLHTSALPILWYAIMVEGPQLLLIQCSKQSNMADTMVLIDPGFCYQVTVQKQPLLITHPLYDDHPPRLSNVTDVVKLLLDLEKYVVCQGLPTQEPSSSKNPVILDRASTCDFLVKKNVNVCTNCRELSAR
ncbi:methyl-CpG-binding domain protein 1b isoform X2 [Genypterus blacodes]|uniref:methyl-CpG-binding domain protein 1b isoform X2 n=1 Tax=Genypterus blacodes TaxID=154954 RepID=UPI003F7741AD